MKKHQAPQQLLKILSKAPQAGALALLCILIASGPVLAQTAPGVEEKSYKRSKLTSDESEMTADRRPLLLTVGEDRTVDLDFEANAGANGIAIGNPQVVATTLVKIGDKRQIVFKPLKADETTVTVRDQDGTIRLIFDVTVTGSNLQRQAAEIMSLLKDIEGLQIRVVGEKIVLDGELLVPADYARMLSVVTDKSYADVTLNLTVLSPLAMKILSDRIQQDISAFAPNVKTRVVNGMIFLEGTVDNIDQANRAKEVANLYLPEIKPGDSLLAKDPGAKMIPNRRLVQNFIVVNPPPPKKQDKLVRVTVHFVELAKSYTKAFGFKWQPLFTADPQISYGTSTGGDVAAQGTTFTGTLSSLFPKLNSAKQAGYARVLKTGTIIVRSGQQGSIEEVTQFPYVVLGQNGQVGSEREAVGLIMKVKPQIVGQSEDIQLWLNVQQLAVVDRAPAAGSPPVTSKHTIETQLYIKSNESAAIGGVNAHDIGTDFNKDDPNQVSTEGSTSPLFSLLRSKAYRKKKSQFVIFVTPEIVENASEGTEDLKKNFRVKVK